MVTLEWSRIEWMLWRETIGSSTMFVVENNRVSRVPVPCDENSSKEDLEQFKGITKIIRNYKEDV